MIVISTSATNKNSSKKHDIPDICISDVFFGKISQSGLRKKALKTSTKANFGKKLAHTNEEKTFKVAIFRQEVVM
jgi:hypothetical protein